MANGTGAKGERGVEELSGRFDGNYRSSHDLSHQIGFEGQVSSKQEPMTYERESFTGEPGKQGRIVEGA